MKKRYYGIIPIIASVALIAGGYSTWVFGANQSNSTSLQKITVGSVDNYYYDTNHKIGAWTITGLDNLKLVFDQEATSLNPNGKGPFFSTDGTNVDTSFKISWKFKEGAISNLNNYDIYFQITMSICKTINKVNCLRLCYGGATCTTSNGYDNSASNYKNRITLTPDSDGNYVLVDNSVDARKISAAYITDSVNTKDKYTTLQTAINSVNDSVTSAGSLGDSAYGIAIYTYIDMTPKSST